MNQIQLNYAATQANINAAKAAEKKKQANMVGTGLMNTIGSMGSSAKNMVNGMISQGLGALPMGGKEAQYGSSQLSENPSTVGGQTILPATGGRRRRTMRCTKKKGCKCPKCMKRCTKKKGCTCPKCMKQSRRKTRRSRK